MKPLLTLGFFLILLSYTGHSQQSKIQTNEGFKFSLRVAMGMESTRYSGLTPSGSYQADKITAYSPVFHSKGAFGIDLGFCLKPDWYLKTGLWMNRPQLLQWNRYPNDSARGHVTSQHYETVEIPVLFQHYLYKKKEANGYVVLGAGVSLPFVQDIGKASSFSYLALGNSFYIDDRYDLSVELFYKQSLSSIAAESYTSVIPYSIGLSMIFDIKTNYSDSRSLWNL